jgi:hypothetical protein
MVFSGASRQQSDEIALLPFALPGSPLPAVEGRPSPAPEPVFALLCDTSSAENWTTIETADRIGMVPLGPPPVYATPEHDSDEVPAYLVLLPRLDLDALRVESVLFFARAAHGPLWPLDRHPASDARADGPRRAKDGAIAAVAGMNLLRSFAWVQWDFARREVRCSSIRPYAPDPDRLRATLPLDASSGPLRVRAAFDGRPQPAVLDTAGDYEAALPEPPLGLLRQVSLGDVVFRQVKASAVDELGLRPADTARIGRRLLERYRVTLDNRQNVVHLEVPPAAPAVP